MIHVLLTIVATGLYLAAGTGLTFRLVKRPTGDTVRTASLLAGATAAVVHAVVVWQTTWTSQGLDLSFFNAASLIGWLMATLLLLSTLRRPVDNLGIAVLPIAGIAALFSLLFGQSGTVTEPYRAGLDAHILLSVVAYSLLALAAVQALLLSIQEHHLRHRHPGGFIRMLPPMQTMEELLFRMLTVGFGFLTLALATGAVFVEDLFDQKLVHKTVLSILAWVFYGVLLWGRLQFGWRGQTATRWSLGGFVTLMVAYFGSKLVLEFIVSR